MPISKFIDQQLPKPADLLLHYNYGAAAVKQWGVKSSVLTSHPDIPRPSALVRCQCVSSMIASLLFKSRLLLRMKEVRVPGMKDLEV